MKLLNPLEVPPQHLQNVLVLDFDSGELVPAYYERISTSLQHGNFSVGHASEWPDKCWDTGAIFPVWKHAGTASERIPLYISFADIKRESDKCLNGGGQ